MTTTTLTHDQLRHFTGDLIRYQHPTQPCVIYTPGVRYVAEQADAYWLIDAIASYFVGDPMKLAIQSDPRLASLQFWRIDVTGHSAKLTATADQDVEPFVTQHIEFTDFPLEQLDIWAGFDGSYWTLYLPSEH